MGCHLGQSHAMCIHPWTGMPSAAEIVAGNSMPLAV